MIHLETINRTYQALMRLKKRLKEPTRMSLAGYFRLHRFPGEYAKFLMETGAIKKTTLNKRGRSEYVWQDNSLPTTSMAKAMIAKHNDGRLAEIAKKKKGKPVRRISPTEQHLLDIKDQLENITRLLTKKNKPR